MYHLVPFATPWWVNALVLTPVLAWLLWRNGNIALGKARLLWTALFGIAFGLVEAAVVVYLRAAMGTLAARQAGPLMIVPESLMWIERYREAATMVMLLAIAWLAGRSAREKAIVFLWTFAFWDFFYYVWLRVTIGWPATLLDGDVLFLIPVPWLGQVWFPMLVSLLTIAAIAYCRWRRSGVERR